MMSLPLTIDYDGINDLRRSSHAPEIGPSYHVVISLCLSRIHHQYGRDG